ncbi:MAG: SoxR reducing system RseC family protein [candidate division WOR-3 bacterium]
MERIGKVIKTDKNIAIVFIETPEECESCEFARFCHIGESGREIICKNNVGAKVGDIVSLEIRESNFIFAISLNFLIPLIFLISGILFGIKIWKSELFGFLTGIIFISFYFLIFIVIEKKRKINSLLPEIGKIEKR